jgi:hypothetical protein
MRSFHKVHKMKALWVGRVYLFVGTLHLSKWFNVFRLNLVLQALHYKLSICLHWRTVTLKEVQIKFCRFYYNGSSYNNVFLT